MCQRSNYWKSGKFWPLYIFPQITQNDIWYWHVPHLLALSYDILLCYTNVSQCLHLYILQSDISWCCNRQARKSLTLLDLYKRVVSIYMWVIWVMLWQRHSYAMTRQVEDYWLKWFYLLGMNYFMYCAYRMHSSISIMWICV